MKNFIKLCVVASFLILIAIGSRLMAHPPTPMNPMSEDRLHADMLGGVHAHYLAVLCQAEPEHVVVIHTKSDSILICLAKSENMGVTLANKDPYASKPAEVSQKLYDFLLNKYIENYEDDEDDNDNGL